MGSGHPLLGCPAFHSLTKSVVSLGWTGDVHSSKEDLLQLSAMKEATYGITEMEDKNLDAMDDYGNELFAPHFINAGTWRNRWRGNADVRTSDRCFHSLHNGLVDFDPEGFSQSLDQSCLGHTLCHYVHRACDPNFSCWGRRRSHSLNNDICGVRDDDIVSDWGIPPNHLVCLEVA
jgi:hypothetical protein